MEQPQPATEKTPDARAKGARRRTSRNRPRAKAPVHAALCQATVGMRRANPKRPEVHVPGSLDCGEAVTSSVATLLFEVARLAAEDGSRSAIAHKRVTVTVEDAFKYVQSTVDPSTWPALEAYIRTAIEAAQTGKSQQ